jgi:endonuclease/exonuclease/phosphatase family metal-dependent hydrolase
MMGDFNARPRDQAMNWIYTREHGQDWDGDWAHGRYREVDRGEGSNPPCRCGEYTWPYPDPTKKIDYIFLSNPQWHDVWGDVTNPGSLSDSDHRLMKGDALLRTP